MEVRAVIFNMLVKKSNSFLLSIDFKFSPCYDYWYTDTNTTLVTSVQITKNKITLSNFNETGTKICLQYHTEFITNNYSTPYARIQ